jgi:hypothetical protein
MVSSLIDASQPELRQVLKKIKYRLTGISEENWKIKAKNVFTAWDFSKEPQPF